MRTRELFIAAVVAALGLSATACSATNGAPIPYETVASQSVPATEPAYTGMSGTLGKDRSPAFQAKTVEGGNVTVTVMPVRFVRDAPLEFEIAMNTHSVDLSGDMLKAVALRDDAGKEYAPTAWDGPSAGGHHRSGKIEFTALTTNTKSVTVIVKGIAGVPERMFTWDLPR